MCFRTRRTTPRAGATTARTSDASSDSPLSALSIVGSLVHLKFSFEYLCSIVLRLGLDSRALVHRAVVTNYQCLEQLAIGRCGHVLSASANVSGGADATSISRSLMGTASRANGRRAPVREAAGAERFAAPDERFVRALVATDLDVHALLWCEQDVGLAAAVGIGRTYSGAAARKHGLQGSILLLCAWTLVLRER